MSFERGTRTRSRGRAGRLAFAWPVDPPRSSTLYLSRVPARYLSRPVKTFVGSIVARSRPAEKLAVKRFMYPARYTHRRRPGHVAIRRDLWRASVFHDFHFHFYFHFHFRRPCPSGDREVRSILFRINRLIIGLKYFWKIFKLFSLFEKKILEAFNDIHWKM